MSQNRVHELIESRLLLYERDLGLKVTNHNGKYCFIDCNNHKRVELGIYDYILDLSEGYFAISLNGRWGCLNWLGHPIAPLLYDFVTVDEYEYGHICLVCGHSGYYMEDDAHKLCYRGKYDLYVGDKLTIANLDEYENDNHEIDIIMRIN